MRAISRAFLQLSPVSCRIVDEHGKPVPLCSAGFVLRPGKSYRLQIIPPFPDEEVAGVHLSTRPEFIQAEPSEKSFNENGESVREVPFHVRSEFFSFRSKLQVQSGELSVGYAFNPGCEREIRPYRCPIVVRPYWTAVIAVGLGLVLSILYAVFEETLAEVAVKRRLDSGWWKSILHSIADNPEVLIWAGGVLTIAAVIVMLYNLFQVRQRSRELRRQFREDYRWDYVAEARADSQADSVMMSGNGQAV